MVPREGQGSGVAGVASVHGILPLEEMSKLMRQQSLLQRRAVGLVPLAHQAASAGVLRALPLVVHRPDSPSYHRGVNQFRGAPDAVALSFVNRINDGDVEGLAALMTEDHELRVFDEPPQIGREVVTASWRSYVSAFTRYLIHPHRFGVRGDEVAILGHTTGSHLGLTDD
jgi:hypothetical protein